MEALRIEHRSTFFGDWWVLIRASDGRREASGFESEDEARQWATERGHEIVSE